MKNILAIEESAMDRLLSVEKDNQSGSIYDSTYQPELSTQEVILTEEEESSDSSSNVSEDENSTDTKESFLDTANEEEISIAKEEIKNIYFINESNISLEDFSYEDTPEDESSLKRFLKMISSKLGDSIKYLYEIGIEYGPMVVKKVARGVLFTLVRLCKIVINTVSNINKYVTRRMNSFKSLKNDLNTLKEAIKSIEDDKEPSDTTMYKNLRVINLLKIHDSIKISKNIEEVSSFIKSTIENLDKAIKNDITSIDQFLHMGFDNNKDSPSLMKVKIDSSYLSLGSVEGYEPDSDKTISYMNNQLLMGDIKLIGYLPIEELTDIESITSGYNNSTIFLGFDKSQFVSMEEIPYLSKGQLTTIVNQLIKLCDLCLSHQSYYESINNYKISFKSKIKLWFNRLVKMESKVSVGNSLIDEIYLKEMFIDKVYITASMDIHDYAVKIINNTMIFVDSNIKHLK